MWAFVVLAKVASRWPHFDLFNSRFAFAVDADRFTFRDDDCIASATVQASDEPKHFHCGVELYHFARAAAPASLFAVQCQIRQRSRLPAVGAWLYALGLALTC